MNEIFAGVPRETEAVGSCSESFVCSPKAHMRSAGKNGQQRTSVRSGKKECDQSQSNATRKLVVDGSWVRKRLYGIGWSFEKKCRGCNKEEGTEEQRLYPSPCWTEVRNLVPGKLCNWNKRPRLQGTIGRGKEELRRAL